MNSGTVSITFFFFHSNKVRVRQGDPLSPYLFVGVVENQGIRGISMENEETKILQYLDDTTAVLADISSAEQLFKLKRK